MSNTNTMRTTLCIIGLLISQVAVNAQGNELAMASTTSATETYTEVANAKAVAPASLAYEITDRTGSPIAAGQLVRNSSLAINVPMGTYTLRINGIESQPVIKTVVINETEVISPVNTSNAALAYIIVKMDKDGAFTYNKMLF